MSLYRVNLFKKESDSVVSHKCRIIVNKKILNVTEVCFNKSILVVNDVSYVIDGELFVFKSDFNRSNLATESDIDKYFKRRDKLLKIFGEDYAQDKRGKVYEKRISGNSKK